LRRVTTRACDLGLRGGGRKIEVEEATRLGDVEFGQDLGLAGGRGGALGHPSFCRLHGHEVHAVELVTDVAPGVTGAVLDDPHEEEPQPAELDVLLDRVVGKFTSRHLRRAPEIGALYAIGEWLNLAQAFTAVRDGRAGRSGRDVCVREPWPADL